MRIRLVSFILLLFSSSFGFAQLQVTIFTGVSLGCSKTVIAPNSTIDVGSLQVGTTEVVPLCLINTGASAISVTNMTATGVDFTVSAGTVLPLVIQPNSASPTVAAFNFAPTAVGTRTAQISFVDTASGSPQTFTLSGGGFTDFGLNTMVVGDNTRTVTAGQTADYDMLIEGATVPPGPTAFSGTVSFSCSNLPPGASCAFTPASSVLVPQSGPQFAVSVSTTARPAASLHHPGFNLWYSLAAVFALVLGASNRRYKIAFVSCFILLGFVISCGGNSKVPASPTPAGTFPFTVNATSNGVTHSKNLVLVVN